MKKIGILTINDYNNYGNRLQNYASQEVMKSLGLSVETVVNSTDFNNYLPSDIKSKVKKLKGKTFNELLIKVKHKLSEKVNNKNIAQIKEDRINTFKNFTNTYIKETEYSISEQNIPAELSRRFDYFITGSDQVWNPIFRYGSTIDFLTFAPKEKRIAYSPSFGIAEIPQEFLDKYRNWLTEISYLSVREEAGAKIIKELTGREATVLVDPTLMLTKEKWLSVSKKSLNKPQGKYLLTYFLGSQTKETKKEIQLIAKNNNLTIVNLADMKDKETYITGPSEFIDYINSASVFCTDSFHGVVFSILMETPFIVYERKGTLPSMNSRINTLLSIFQLESRITNNITSNKQIFDINFSHIPPILNNERQKALNYLKYALNIKEESHL